MHPRLLKVLSIIFNIITFGILAICLGIGSLYWYFSKDLPSYKQLEAYKPAVISRVYAGDGSLIGQFARERRLFYPIKNIPLTVRNAFIAAEDKNFYTHTGVDLSGISRAMLRNITSIGSGKRMQGASTITQQVMKNFLFQDERPYVRKIKEAILASRFEATFTKDQILELYLNEIFLGVGTYGVASAAHTYFGKKLNELDIHEVAYLAALPKGPNNYHPIKYREKAIQRRNYVLSRMADDGYISQTQMITARNMPLETKVEQVKEYVDATYFVEEIRRDLLERYGEESLYKSGFMVSATINTKLQKIARNALRESLIAFDRQRGWRGPIANIAASNGTLGDMLKKFTVPIDLPAWQIAVVTSVRDENAEILLKGNDKVKGNITFDALKWTKNRQYPQISDVLAQGDVVYVKPQTDNNAYELMQIPEVNGAIMVMDPHSGRVLAQQGGFSFGQSQFNRATQAHRQPGSSFKPFVYAAALERGYSPNSLINDGPYEQIDDLGRKWRPMNYDRRFLGDVPLRIGLEKSRNLMTIRLAKDIGMRRVIDFANRLGVGRGMKPYLPMALGAGEVTLEEMVTAYATFANGGYKVTPIYFDRVQDRDGYTILTADTAHCEECLAPKDRGFMSNPQRIIDSISNYQMVSMLQGVVENGTGRRLKSLNVPIAGKTGTTNESRDAWFMGFTTDLVFGTYIGYDQPKPMGRRATGGSTAAPLIKKFLEKAIVHTNPQKFTPPRNAILSRVSRGDGSLAETNGKNTVLEAFKPGQEPKKVWYKQEEFNANNEQDYYRKEHLDEVGNMINLGTGGLY